MIIQKNCDDVIWQRALALLSTLKGRALPLLSTLLPTDCAYLTWVPSLELVL